MRFRIPLFFFTFLIASVFFGFSAKAATDQPLPTVEIFSYTHTKNNDVVAEVGGSGTIIRSDGLILTNNHVVEKDDDETYDIFAVCLTFNPQQEPKCEYTADLVARNREMDTALLQIHEKNIRGKKLSTLPVLRYDHGVKAKEEEAVSIVGYPGIGLDTVTFTKGLISGFEEINGFTYVKTDTTIAPGNSGGTALDAEGNFLGIPTYGQSTFGSSLGYFLDITEAVDWIKAHQNDQKTASVGARELLTAKLQRENDAENEKTYSHPFAPKFNIALPEDWEFAELDRYSVVLRSEDEIANYQVAISLQDTPFKITDEYLKASIFEKLERNKDFYTNYQRVESEFLGVRAFLISYQFEDTKSVNYIVPYGSTLFFISYEYDLKREQEALKAYSEAVAGIELIDPPTAPALRENVTRQDPPLSIATVPGWLLQENNDPRSEDLIVQFFQPENVEGEISLSTFDVSETDQTLSAADLLQDTLENFESVTGFRLISTNEHVVLDGLPGIAITFVYQGEELNQMRKTSKIYLRDGERGYFIQYDDLDTNYDRFLPDFIAILQSFQNLNPENQTAKGSYDIGSLNTVFKDITYHRYESEISRLKERGIVEGYPNNTFRPEKAVSRAEALSILIRSKMISEEKRSLDTTMKELKEFENGHGELDFLDTKDLGKMRPYLRFARNLKIVRGYPNGNFDPDAEVTLAELSKMLLELYKIPTWQTLDSENLSWYKPYLDKAFELEVIPYGIYEPNHIVTRGEIAFTIARLLERVEDRFIGF